MDHTTETRGERTIPADKLAALYETEREARRLRAAIQQHRETELARLKSSGMDDHGKPLFTPLEHDERLWDALTERT